MHAHMPGQVIRLVETRHGGGVQYAGHGDNEGSGDRGSAAAVTNKAGNEQGGKGGRERESERQKMKPEKHSACNSAHQLTVHSYSPSCDYHFVRP